MAVTLRASRPEDLAYVTALERHPDNAPLIGQWTDTEHLAAIAGRDRWCHWIVVRNENARAQAVHRKHGFETFVPEGEEARRFDALAEAPADRCFRMRRIDGGWLGG